MQSSTAALFRTLTLATGRNMAVQESNEEIAQSPFFRVGQSEQVVVQHSDQERLDMVLGIPRGVA